MNRWIANLKLTHKLLVIIVTCLIPLAMLTFYFVRGEQSQIGVTEGELEGMAAYQPLAAMLVPIGEHEAWVSAALSGDAAATAKAQAAAEEVAKLIARRDALHVDYGAAPAEDEQHWSAVKAAWNDVASRSVSSVADAKKTHDAVRAQIQEYRDLIGAKAALVLDPSAVTMFVLDAAVVQAIDFEVQFSKMRSAAMTIGAAGRSTPALSADLLRSEVLAQRSLDAISADLDSAANGGVAGEVLRKATSDGFKRLDAAFGAFGSWGEQSVSGGSASASVNTILAQSAQIGALYADVHRSLHEGALTQLSDTLRGTRATRNQALLVVLVALGLCLAVTYTVAQSTTRALQRAGDLANRLAEGDYTARSEQSGRDELAVMMRTLHTMQGKVASVLRDVTESAATVSTAAREINAGTLDLSQRTEQQAANLEETASSMEEMSATVRQNADNAKLANQLAQAARDQAEAGGQVVSQAVGAMSAIDASSKRIADIIGVIDEIAFQTNLLALNAAVEAARAGDQGRGFAVVASEVRSLAQRSATAAKEIKELIHDSVNKVEEGSRLVSDSGRHLEDIVSSVKKVSDVVGEISTASQEQAVSAEQISRAVLQMDEGTQQNAAMVEQASAAAASMNEQAGRLMQLTSFFHLTGDGAAPVAQAPASAPANAPRSAPKKASVIAAATAPKGAEGAARPERRGDKRPWSQPPAVALGAAGTKPGAAPQPKRAVGQIDGGDWSEF